MKLENLKGLPAASRVTINAKDAKAFSLGDVADDVPGLRQVEVKVSDLRTAIEARDASQADGGPSVNGNGQGSDPIVLGDSQDGDSDPDQETDDE